MFSIGEFSTITSLSIKTLRLYHEKGLLVPAKIDEWTGYRFYDDENYERARSIKILKGFDFTLQEIKEILDECENDGDLVEQLEFKLQNIQQKIDRFTDMSHSIKLTIQQEREAAMKNREHFEIEEKTVDTILMAGYRMKGRYDQVGEGFSIIGRHLGRHINGKAFTLYYDSDYKEEGADFEAGFPIRKGSSSDEISVRELKGGKCVSLIHKGPYENLSESYKRIIEYKNKKGYKTSIPTREVYIKGPGMIFKGNPENYLTEIIMMVEEAK